MITNPDWRRLDLNCWPWIQQSFKGTKCFYKPQGSLALYTKWIFMNKQRIWIHESESMDFFLIMIDKSNLVNPQIWVREPNPSRKIQFVLICKDWQTNPASLIYSFLLNQKLCRRLTTNFLWTMMHSAMKIKCNPDQCLTKFLL